LAHLVTANCEIGFKQCLPLAYDPDPRKRTIFAYVFARVIGQGTVFNPVGKPLAKTKHASLCDVSFKIHHNASAPLSFFFL
jgi:neurofibromin 1